MGKKTNPFKSSFFSKRLKAFLFFIYLIFLILILKVFLITIIKGIEYFEKSENNFLLRRDIEAPRGIIYDRFRHPIAVNRQTYSLFITRYKIPISQLTRTVKEISSFIGREIPIKISKLKMQPSWKPILLMKGLKLDEVTPIFERMHQFQGISIEEDYERYYPYGTATAHISGFVGLIDKGEQKEYLSKGYLRTSYVGKAGIEGQYEDLLYGKKGLEILVRDAKGRKKELVENIPPKPGKNILLTLNLDLQLAAEKSLGERKGAVVVANPDTGEILALVSYPSFEPSQPSKKENIFLNRAIAEYYSPGSTFKPLTAITALENGYSPALKIFCDSYFYLKGRDKPFRCDFTAGHGSLDLEEGLKFSCNIYFYTLANKLGGNKLLSQASRFGFGEKTGIDLPGEKSGFIPLNDSKSLFRGEVVMLGIGQGRISITPIQMLKVYCAIANGGKCITPHLFLDLDETRIDEAESDNKSELKKEIQRNLNSEVDLNIEQNVLKIVRRGLYRVVNEEGGTAYRVGFDPKWRVAGKTGTAQNWRGELPDAWFACWAPFDNPKIAIVAIVENAGHGADIAAPIAKDILQKFFEKN